MEEGIFSHTVAFARYVWYGSLAGFSSFIVSAFIFISIVRLMRVVKNNFKDDNHDKCGPSVNVCPLFSISVSTDVQAHSKLIPFLQFCKLVCLEF